MKSTVIYALQPAKPISPNWVIFVQSKSMEIILCIFHQKTQGPRQVREVTRVSVVSGLANISKISNKQRLATQPCPCFPSMVHLAFHKFEGPSAWPSSFKIPGVNKQEGADCVCVCLCVSI